MELIHIQQATIGDGAVNSVNARELHAKLEVRTRFNDWIRRAIDRYGFEENIDYSKLSNANPSIGVEVIVTLDMTRRLDDDEKDTQKVRTLGGEQVMVVLLEKTTLKF